MITAYNFLYLSMIGNVCFFFFFSRQILLLVFVSVGVKLTTFFTFLPKSFKLALYLINVNGEVELTTFLIFFPTFTIRSTL